MNRKDYDLAIKDYEKVVTLESENKAAKNHIIMCRKKLQDEHQREKKLYQNMFSKMTASAAAKVGGRLSLSVFFFISLCKFIYLVY